MLKSDQKLSCHDRPLFSRLDAPLPTQVVHNPQVENYFARRKYFAEVFI